MVRESVTEAEDVSRTILSDKAGKLLSYAIKESGLEGECQVVHAVKCWSPEKPSAAEVKACNPYILGEVPGFSYLVLLGKAACQAFGIQGALDELVGKPIQKDGLTYLPLWSPEGVLARPVQADAWISHWRGLAALLRGSGPQDDPSVTFGKIVDLGPSYAVDIETTGLDPQRGTILSIAASNGDQTWVKEVSDPSDLVWYRDNLKYKSIAHNVRMEKGWHDAWYHQL